MAAGEMRVRAAARQRRLRLRLRLRWRCSPALDRAQAGDGPPPPPNCPLDPPPGLICVPGPKATYVFEGAAANTAAPTTKCEVTLEDAVPADQEGSDSTEMKRSLTSTSAA
jgi:hypothetical protein